MRLLSLMWVAAATVAAWGCGGTVMESAPNGAGGAAGSSGASGSSASGGTAGSGGDVTDASTDTAGSGGSVSDGGKQCFSTEDCAATEWCDLEPAPLGQCASGGKAGICRQRPDPDDCPDYDECPGVCACDGTWYCDACHAHVAGLSITADKVWCIPPDAGPNDCDPGFCQDAIMSSCGDPDYVPFGSMSCTGPAGDPGFCCLPSCGGHAGTTCPPGQYCHYPPELGPACGTFDGMGVCQWSEPSCDDDCPGVCGCDGQFYCNTCEAHNAGTDVSDSMSCMVDGGTEFPSQLPGTWLIGWTGGINRFSWVRFETSSPFDGPAQVLAGDLAYSMPYWECSGEGTWTVTAQPNTVLLLFPPSCGIVGESLTFVSFTPASGYPPGATLSAGIEVTSAPSSIEGYKFPDGQCDADMTTCEDPFAY